MVSNDGFVPISAIFYAVFHPVQGTQIVHQVPEGSIGSSSDNNDSKSEQVLFNFDTVKNYIIPKPQLCNKLVSFKINGFRVLGLPVNIESSRYSRNSFNFNFCFVLPYNADTSPYESAVSRMGKMFRALEEQSLLLSKLDKDQAFFSDRTKMEAHTATSDYTTPGYGKIQRFSLRSIESLIHQIFQDLNNYSECCIPIDSANSVDIKLFPMLPPPVNLRAYQVPMSTVKLSSLMDVVWDPTMVKIVPFINGINSVKRISELADADYLLTKQCIQHLMHYQCIILVDIFQFNNIYAPTNNVGKFLKTNGMAEECQAYIITASSFDDSAFPASTSISVANSASSTTPATPATSSFYLPDKAPRGIPQGRLPPSTTQRQLPESASPLSKALTPGISQSVPTKDGEIKIPSKATLFYLYRSLNQGQTIKEWYIQHQKALKNIDIRRFINFGLVRGIIYRVHSYPILHRITKHLEAGEMGADGYDEVLERMQRKVRRASKRRSFESAKQEGLLKSVVMESNLKTGKKTRTVSFNYNVERPATGLRDKHPSRRRNRESNSSLENDSADYLDSDVFDSDSQQSHGNAVEDDERYDTSSGEESDDSEKEAQNETLIKLVKLVRASQHFDSICTELQKSRSEVERLLDKLGAHSLINS